jgi:DMSO/TMAO reductase YedYZ molybdopterin-dependent catalytic subunit
MDRHNSLLQEAGIGDNAGELVVTGLDWGVQGGEVQPYQRSLTRDEALRDEVLLVYAMNGEPLPPQHGFPLRLLVPDWYGMASVKWLASIEAVAGPFEGYQMTKSYRYAQNADDLGDPVTLKRPRALVVPPGIPDFASRLRILNAGQVPLKGRAWSGRAGITRVEVSIDGSDWTEAELERPVSELAWRGWSFAWNATPGRHLISVKATDDTGDTQPDEPDWNFQGMGNNAVYPLEVLVV